MENKKDKYKEDYVVNLKDLLRKISYMLSFIFGFKIITLGNMFKSLTYKYCDFLLKAPNKGGIERLFAYFIIYLIINLSIYVYTKKDNKKEECFFIYNIFCLMLGIISFYCLGFVLFFRCDTGP